MVTDCIVEAAPRPSELVDFVGSALRPQGNPYSNTYIPRWRNLTVILISLYGEITPTFHGAIKGNIKKSSPEFLSHLQQDKKLTLEDVLTRFIQTNDTKL